MQTPIESVITTETEPGGHRRWPHRAPDLLPTQNAAAAAKRSLAKALADLRLKRYSIVPHLRHITYGPPV
ncbi:hypothetical protein MPLSOD_330083 [Mesorhizobium sp. SOD10]|nr:hypothetical protein MPLSOD_330083 [Mesorhizobium sp. SOD10]